MTAAATTVAGLKTARPEWGPWLAVVEEMLRDRDASTWDAVVPDDAIGRPTRAPFLSGATLTVEPRTVRNLLERLIRVASRSGTREMATLKSALDSDVDVLELFKGSLCQDTAASAAAAATAGVDAAALEAVTALLPVPFLQACNRRWAVAGSRSWIEGYCPVCGAWPAFAETRGIERTRFFRCGRCGGEWHARPLRCPFCGMDDHTALVSLVPENAELNVTIDGCRSCLGYVKTFTRLQGCAPEAVILDDLASVHVDLAIIQQGYTRPPGAGHPLDVMVTGKNRARRFFA